MIKKHSEYKKDKIEALYELLVIYDLFFSALKAPGSTTEETYNKWFDTIELLSTVLVDDNVSKELKKFLQSLDEKLNLKDKKEIIETLKNRKKITQKDSNHCKLSQFKQNRKIQFEQLEAKPDASKKFNEKLLDAIAKQLGEKPEVSKKYSKKVLDLAEETASKWEKEAEEASKLLKELLKGM